MGKGELWLLRLRGFGLSLGQGKETSQPNLCREEYRKPEGGLGR